MIDWHTEASNSRQAQEHKNGQIMANQQSTMSCQWDLVVSQHKMQWSSHISQVECKTSPQPNHCICAGAIKPFRSPVPCTASELANRWRMRQQKGPAHWQSVKIETILSFKEGIKKKSQHTSTCAAIASQAERNWFVPLTPSTITRRMPKQLGRSTTIARLALLLHYLHQRMGNYGELTWTYYWHCSNHFYTSMKCIGCSCQLLSTKLGFSRMLLVEGFRGSERQSWIWTKQSFTSKQQLLLASAGKYLNPQPCHWQHLPTNYSETDWNQQHIIWIVDIRRRTRTT